MNDDALLQPIRTRWSSSNPDDIFDVDNPSTGHVFAKVHGSGAREVDAAVRTAHAAFQTWRDVPAARRGEILVAAGHHLKQHADELAHLVARENGKPVRDALSSDITSLVASFSFFGGLCGRLDEEEANVDYPFMTSRTVREPFGVVAGIIPFNWPPIHTGAKVAPALAAGNVIVIKPGDQAPLTIMRIVDLLNEVLPPDILHVVTGIGPSVGQALTTHPLVRKISFTGSPATGTAVLRAAATRHVPVLCELGGKNPLVVMADADLDQAVRDALDGAFFNKGEACTAASRLIVHEDVHDDFVERLAGAVRQLRCGDGMAPQTQIGPVISKTLKQKIEDYIRIGKAEGARVVAQGQLPQEDHLAHGYFVPPTLFADVTHQMRIAQEEIFGPVACVMRFSNEDEAVAIANSTQFALVAGVFSSSQETARRLARRIEAGIVFVNNYNRILMGTPFGGTKSSGYGREHSAGTLREFSYQKAIRIPTQNVPVPEWLTVTEILGSKDGHDQG